MAKQWKIVDDGNRIVEDTGDHLSPTICTVHGSPEESALAKRLIAAAPQLLEALGAVTGALEVLHLHIPRLPGKDTLHKAYLQAKAAIKTAEKEKPCKK